MLKVKIVRQTNENLFIIETNLQNDTNWEKEARISIIIGVTHLYEKQITIKILR